jgi:hypothetical protein
MTLWVRWAKNVNPINFWKRLQVNRIIWVTDYIKLGEVITDYTLKIYFLNTGMKCTSSICITVWNSFFRRHLSWICVQSLEVEKGKLLQLQFIQLKYPLRHATTNDKILPDMSIKLNAVWYHYFVVPIQLSLFPKP